MNPLAIVRKIGKFVRGGGGAPQIILACTLGFTLGMIPGFSLTTILLILAIILLNVSIGMTLISVAVGKLASLILAPVTYSIGYAVIHNIGLEPLFVRIADTPVLALLDLHVYCLTGGLLAGGILGFLLGLLPAWVVVQMRRGLVAANERSQLVQKLSKNFLVRFLLRILFGKSKRPLSELLDVRFPLVRKSGVIVTVVLAVILIGTPVLLVDHILAAVLADNLAAANGAEVNIERADLAIFSGRLNIEGLQMTDRDNPSHNLLAADKLTSDISIADLLAKRVVIDRLEINHLRSDVPRSSPGKVYPRDEAEPDDAADDDDEQGGRLLDYFENIEEYRKYLDYLEKAADYLRQQQRQKEGEPPISEQEMLARAYFDRSASHILVRHPALLIRELIIDRISFRDAEFRLQGAQLASHPALNPHPMSIHFGSLRDQGGEMIFGDRQRLFLTFGFHQPNLAHNIDLFMSGLPIPSLSNRVPVDVSNGLADVSVKGDFSSDSLALPFAVALQGLQSSARPDESILGLSPEVSRRLMSNISEMTLAGIIGGTLKTPRVRLDEKATLQGMKAALGGAARSEIAGRIDAQLTKLGPGLDIKAENLLDGKLPSLPAKLLPSSLTGGNSQKEDGDADKTTNEEDAKKPNAGNLLDRFRR